MATDTEIERSLNAVSVTLNDQRLDRMDLDRVQQIITAALGGEQHLRVVHDAEHLGTRAWVHDQVDAIVGRIDLEDGHWTVFRYGYPQGGGPAPSATA